MRGSLFPWKTCFFAALKAQAAAVPTDLRQRLVGLVDLTSWFSQNSHSQERDPIGDVVCVLGQLASLLQTATGHKQSVPFC